MTLTIKPVKKTLFLICLFLLHNTAYTTGKNTNNLCSNPKYVNTIHELWKQRKPTYQQWIRASNETPYSLYNIQGETNNLLKYAWGCKDQYIINELNTLYLGALKTLDTTNMYSFYYYPNDKRQSSHPLNATYKIWLDEKKPMRNESILASSQFLSLISELASYIAEVPSKNRTSSMNQVLKYFTPILLSHYKRWIFNKPGPFQVKGWGCKYNNHYVKTGMNHLEYLTKKKNYQLGNNTSHAYCNAILDTDLWIVSGVSNLLAAHKKAPLSIPLTQSLQKKLRAYLITGLDLIASRIKTTKLTNFNGQVVEGRDFDPGIWSDYADYKYAGLSEKNTLSIKRLISANKPNKANSVSWDLSHARRFVHVFDSLTNNRKILGLSFPSRRIVTGLTNQLLYKVFNKDFKYPLFTNYMNGSNGWFRVNYSGRKGYGYGPWDMSSSVLTGGFALWQPYNKDIEKVYNALNSMINSKDPKVISHRKKHYEQHLWYNYKRSASYTLEDRYYPSTQTMLIQLLPSMYHFPQDVNLPLIP